MAVRAARATVAPVYQRLAVDDLSGGLDLRHSPTLVPSNRSRVLRNWSLQEQGALVVFPGWLSFSTTSLGGLRPQGAQRIYLSGLTCTLAAYNGSVYKPDDAGVWGAAVLAGRSSTNEIYFPFDRDFVAVFDGTNIPKKTIDGTTWYQLGIDAPGAAPTLAAVAGGSLTNGSTYEISYSYKRAASPVHEGNESAVATQAAAGANLTVRCTLPRSTDPQVDTIVVYARDVTAGESVRRRTGTVANPGAGSATYDITTKNWTAADVPEAPTDHTVPTALVHGLVWKNRWWAKDPTVGNRLRFTQIFEPQSWPTTFYIDIPFERGDSIAALVAQGDTLVVWGQTKPYLVIGQTSLDFEVRPSLGAQAGAVGPRAVDILETGIVHASADGAYLFDGATDRLLTDDVDVAWRDLIGASAVADLQKIAVCYHGLYKEVRIALPRTYPFSEPGELILDLHRTRTDNVAWFMTNRPVGGYLHWNGNETTTGNRGRLFSWGLTVGKLYEERVGTTADGGDLVCDYAGPALSSGLHAARFIDLKGEYQPAAGSFVVEPYVDGVSQGQIAIDISGGLSQYAVAQYGSSLYAGAGRKPFTTDLPLEAEGYTVWLVATYTGKSTFRWYSYAFGMVPEAEARGL